MLSEIRKVVFLTLAFVLVSSAFGQTPITGTFSSADIPLANGRVVLSLQNCGQTPSAGNTEYEFSLDNSGALSGAVQGNENNGCILSASANQSYYEVTLFDHNSILLWRRYFKIPVQDEAWDLSTATPLSPLPAPLTQGIAGPPGNSSTISIGEVTSVPADQPPSVTNSGTATDAILNFQFPKSAITSVDDSLLSANIPRYDATNAAFLHTVTADSFVGDGSGLTGLQESQIENLANDLAGFCHSDGTNCTGPQSLAGDGSQLTNLNASELSSGTVADGLLSSNIAKLDSVSNTFTGSIQASSFTGDGSDITGITEAHVNNLVSDLANRAQLNAASNTFAGDITAVKFHGDGSALTNIPYPHTNNFTPHQFFVSYDSTTGSVGKAQPTFADIAGTAVVGQIPSLPESQITGLTADLAGLCHSNGDNCISPSQVDSGTATFTLGGDQVDGVGASIVCQAGYSCTNVSGTVNLTTGGSGITFSGSLFTVNFSVSRTVTPTCVVNFRQAVQAEDENAHAVESNNSFNLVSTTMLGVNKSYTLKYFCF